MNVEHNGHMTAAVLYGREDLKIETVAIPAVGPGDLLVRVGVALTCGTDFKVWKQGYHARMITPPALFGHELAGVVVEAGEAVRDRFQLGMRVVAANSGARAAAGALRRGGTSDAEGQHHAHQRPHPSP